MNNYKRDIVSAFIFIVLGVLIYAGSYSIIVTKADTMGPQFFPRLVAVCMIGLSIIQIIKSIMLHKKEKTETALNFKINKKVIISIIVLFAYALLVEKVGFLILTIIYVFIQIYLLLPQNKYKDKKTVIITSIVSVAAPVIIYFTFYEAFSIFLPPGILG